MKQSQLIGRLNCSEVSRSPGIMTNAPATYPCRGTPAPPSKNSVTHSQRSPNMHHITTTNHNMANRCKPSTPRDTTPPLNKEEITKIRQIVGTALFYGRAVDPILLMPLSELALQQEKATEQTKADARQLLDFWAIYPDALLRYWASDMVLENHSDASYLTAPNARSRVGGHWYLGRQLDTMFITDRCLTSREFCAW